MFEMKTVEELAPRMNIDKDKEVLVIDGPNLLAGHVKAKFRSFMELAQIEKESFGTIFAWFSEPDKRRAETIIDEASRIVSPGGDLWLIVPKRHSIEQKKATGITDDIVVPRVEKNGLVQKKSLGIGPHLFAIRMMKPGIG
jgi:hypothetical protein